MNRFQHQVGKGVVFWLAGRGSHHGFPLHASPSLCAVYSEGASLLLALAPENCNAEPYPGQESDPS